MFSYFCELFLSSRPLAFSNLAFDFSEGVVVKVFEVLAKRDPDAVPPWGVATKSCAV